MRIGLLTIAIFSSLVVHAQLSMKPLQRSFNLKTAADTVLNLPFWDDFSQSGNAPDTLLWSFGPNVYINATLGQNPPTYKVATFDGITNTGLAYDIQNETNGAGDSLVSQPIDLTKVSQGNRSTVYLSFFWQAGGNGELPDEKDSLVLYFNKPLTDSTFVWDQRWTVRGGIATAPFQQVLVPVDSAAYFHSKFRFKFVSYSSQQGPFDTWHLDYVYLNEHRSANDFYELDQAIAGTPSLLFEPYYELPAEVFFENPDRYLSNQRILVSNMENDVDPTVYFYSLQNLTTGEDFGTYQSNEASPLNPLEVREVAAPGFSSISIPIQADPLDSQVLQSTFRFASENNLLQEQTGAGTTISYPIDLKLNDTLRQQYLLQNYYAYDDGSAEFAIAINANGGQLAIQYLLAKSDTLTHLDIYFPNIAPESVGNSIDLVVWDELADDGILTKQPYTIQEPAGVNQFTRVKLSVPILTPDTIYIGFEQLTENYIGVGFDRSNDAASNKIYSNTTGTWVQNTQFSGAMMFRPVFDFDSTFFLSSKPKIVEPVAYPNPSSGQIFINEPYDEIAVFDLSGHLMNQLGYAPSHRLLLKDGIYLLKITHKSNVTTQKLIIKNE